MFGNLIESGSHASDVRRKSSFFLLTLAAYALLILLAGVASIYAYDAQLEQANLDALEQIESPEISFIEPEDFKPAPTLSNNNKPRPAAPNEPIIRQVAQATTAMPNYFSDVSNQPVKNASLPSIPFAFGNVDKGAPVATATNDNSPFGTSEGETSGSRGNALQLPPPLPLKPPVKPSPSPEAIRNLKPISGGVVNGLAISKPEPPYPQLAKQARVTGIVTIQIVINETGKVASAQIVSGHPLLRQAALDAARRARFTPTKLSDVPVKVQGTITYNFKLE